MGTTLGHPRRPVHNQALEQAPVAHTRRRDRQGDARVAAQVTQLPLVGDRGEDNLVAFNPDPRSSDVRGAVLVQRDHMSHGVAVEQLTSRALDRDPATLRRLPVPDVIVLPPTPGRYDMKRTPSAPEFVCADVGGPHIRLCAGRSTLGVMVADRAVAILKTDDMAETIRWYLAAGFELRDQFRAAIRWTVSWRETASSCSFWQAKRPARHPDHDRLSLPLSRQALSPFARNSATSSTSNGALRTATGEDGNSWCGTPAGISSRSPRTPATSRRRGERTPPCSPPPETSEHVPPVGIVELF